MMPNILSHLDRLVFIALRTWICSVQFIGGRSVRIPLVAYTNCYTIANKIQRWSINPCSVVLHSWIPQSTTGENHGKKISVNNRRARIIWVGKKNNFTYFTNYYAENKRNQSLSAINHIAINIKGKSVLDIGPGAGDSLEVAKSLGASRCLEIDSEPYFIKLVLLRGHQAYLKDYTMRSGKNGYFPQEVAGVDFI